MANAIPQRDIRKSAMPRFRGHEGLRRSLRRALARGMLPGTVLLHGPPGCGKQSLAHWMARTRLCAEPDKPCDRCGSCRRALRLEHPDIHWYFPLPRPKGVSGRAKLEEALESARHERLGELRANPLRTEPGGEVRGIYLAVVRALRKQAHRRPATAEEHVFIVGEAEHLVPQEASPEAANALLKLLEEPPGPCRFILTSSKPGSLLDTIRSRTLPIRIPPLPPESVSAFLVEECDAQPAEADSAAALSQGSIGVALRFLDSSSALTEARNRALALLRAATEGKSGAAYARALEFSAGGARSQLDLLAALALWIRDLGAVCLGRDDHVVNADQLSFLRSAAGRLRLSPGQVAAAVEHVEEAQALASGNANPQLLISAMLLDLKDTFGGRR